MAREQQGPPADLTRLGDRRSRDRHDLDALLDEVLVATVGTVVDGLPWSVPIFFVRDRDRVLLHGSTGGGILRHLAAGAPVTLTVFSLDAIVVAHTAFESSANYRSAVLSGTAESLTGTDAEVALDLLTDRLVPGRVIEVRSSTRREYAATTVLALPIGEESWIYKARSGQAGEPDEETEAWAGIVPLRTVAGLPATDSWVPDARPVPASVEELRRRYR